jgi:hypothetical protein
VLTTCTGPVSSRAKAPASADGGAIAGGIIGALAGVAVMVLIVVLYRRHRQARHDRSRLTAGTALSEWPPTTLGAARLPQLQSPPVGGEEADGSVVYLYQLTAPRPEAGTDKQES